MSRVEAMLAQAELMLNQRSVLPANRFCMLKQLREHDQKLFSTVCWLQQHAGQDTSAQRPQWFSWLLCDADMQLLPLDAIAHFSHPQDSWLLLHQLKLRLFTPMSQHWQKLLQQQCVASDNELWWALAYYLQLPLKPLTDDTPLTSTALWYSMLSKPAANQEDMHYSFSANDSLNIQYQLMLQLNRAGYQADLDSYTAAQLLESVAPCRYGLMLLLAIADAAMQAKLINYLAQTDQGTAITAMGYSGQLKYVPLLSELAQQPELHTVAADALTLLLGVLDSEACIADPGLLKHFHSSHGSSRYLSGAAASELQLNTVWRSGNVQQRQLAGLMLTLQSHQQPVSPADALQVPI